MIGEGVWREAGRENEVRKIVCYSNRFLFIHWKHSLQYAHTHKTQENAKLNGCWRAFCKEYCMFMQRLQASCELKQDLCVYRLKGTLSKRKNFFHDIAIRFKINYWVNFEFTFYYFHNFYFSFACTSPVMVSLNAT